MKITGTVKDSVKENPIAGAKAVFQVGDKELSVVYSNKNGEFEHSEAADYVGKVLTCNVQKEGYKPHTVTHEIKEEAMLLNIELVLEKPNQVELILKVTDTSGNPLEGAELTLTCEGEAVSTGYSKSDGTVIVIMGPEFEGKSVTYESKLAGFDKIIGEVSLQEKTSHNVIMNAAPITKPAEDDIKPVPFWKQRKFIIAVSVVVIIAAALILNSIFGAKPGRIHYFQSNKRTINKGQSVILKWSASNASLMLNPGNMRVGNSGSRQVKPQKTTKYTLLAKDKRGRQISMSARVLVAELATNRRGQDYHNFQLSTADFKKCQRACEGDSRCKAWTYVKPGIQGTKARCWLKNRVPSSNPESCCVSGIK